MNCVTRSAKILIVLLTLIPALRAFGQSAATGISWGYARTYWDGTWYKDGYAEAGTGGNMLSVRREMPMNDRTMLTVAGSYSWLRHTTTTLVEPVEIDPTNDQVISGGELETRTHKTYFREIDLALHAHYYLDNEGQNKFYLGGGPAVRWGSAGKREQDSRESEFHAQAVWFGLSALAGLRQQWTDEGLITFVEPQMVWSPDPADRYQKVFPPVNLIVAMGILW